jgi:hypothetical protein
MRSVCVLLCLVGVAHAKPAASSEDSPRACNDHIDNDRNGLVDCDDPKCNGIGHCRMTLVDPEMDAPTTGKGTLTAGILMLVIGPALAGASAAVYVDGLAQHETGRRSLELAMGGILTAAGAALAISGVVLVYKGWHRYKEDVEMGLALAPNKINLRVTF